MKRIITIIGFLALLMAACGNSAAPANQPETSSDETVVEANAEAPSEPTATPEPESASTLSSDELNQKWRKPVGGAVMVSMACNMTLETAGNIQSGEIEGFESLGALMIIGGLFKGIEESIDGWEPAAEQEVFKASMTERINVVKSVVSQWIDKEIASTDIAGLLGTECESADELGRNVAEAAKADGLSDEDVLSIGEEILNSIQESLASIGEASESDPEPAPEPTAVPVGSSRADPFPQGSMVSAPNWDFQILEIMRGTDAEQAIMAANQFNDPPPSGQEYLLLKIKAKSTSEEEKEHSIGSFDFNITGSTLLKRGPASVVAPEPKLDGQLFPGGEIEGWIVFLVNRDESNLILIFDEVFNFDNDNVRYLAIDDAATISVSSELSSIQPTDTGLSRSEPAPFGNTVISDDWQITVLEVIRGPNALQIAQEANQFNDSPDDGFEYVVVRLKTKYIGLEDKAVSVDRNYFKITGDANVVHDPPSVVGPEPKLGAELYPGGEVEGWVLLQASVGETGLKAIFQPWFEFLDENKRYLSLQ